MVASLAALTLRGRAVLASGTGKGALRLWEAASGALLWVVDGHQDWVTSLAALTLAGRAVVISGSNDFTVRLWDAASGAPLRILKGHQDSVTSLAALTLAGRAVVASASLDKTIRLWDAASGAPLRVLEGHRHSVTSLTALTLAGRTVLASGSHDQTIRLWDAASGANLATIPGGLGDTGVATFADGARLLAKGQGGWAVVDLDFLAANDFDVDKGLRMRRFALCEDYEGSFVDLESDSLSGGLRATAVGPNAWRDFLAVGEEADGRQTLRPIDDMAPAPI
jgi:WD40 repeat protein